MERELKVNCENCATSSSSQETYHPEINETSSPHPFVSISSLSSLDSNEFRKSKKLKTSHLSADYWDVKNGERNICFQCRFGYSIEKTDFNCPNCRQHIIAEQCIICSYAFYSCSAHCPNCGLHSLFEKCLGCGFPYYQYRGVCPKCCWNLQLDMCYDCGLK